MTTVLLWLLHWFYAAAIFLRRLAPSAAPRRHEAILDDDSDLVEVEVDRSVLLVRDSIGAVLRDPNVRRALHHPASLFITARACAQDGGPPVDLTRCVQTAMSSFYAPADMAVTAEDFLRWCAERVPDVRADMDLIVIDATFQEIRFRGSDRLSLAKQVTKN